MSLDYASPKKFPHKLALIDVQFLENVSIRYLWHVLFLWRLLMWKKKFSKEVQMLFPLLAKWGQLQPLHFWQTLSNISSCGACRWSEVKGKFVIALGAVVLSTFPSNLRELWIVCNQETQALSSNFNKNALYPKQSKISKNYHHFHNS